MSIYHFPLLLCLFLQCLSLQAIDRYRCRIPDASGRQVHVEAIINATEPMLLMSPFGAGHLEHGWATFVHDLKAMVDGAPVQMELMSGGAFKIDCDPGEVITLSYSVRVEHDLTSWPFGSDEAAYVKGEVMMATGNALFITRLDLDTASVQFELPDHYSVATAWQPSGTNEYRVFGAQELVWTVLLLGEIHQHEHMAGNMRVLLAFGNDLLDARETLVDITARAIHTYTEYYGGAPLSSTPSRTYLQVINVDTTFEGGGAAFTNSMSILLSDPPERCDSISTHCWHHIMVHELGHLWNGNGLMVNEDEQWFLEGFTDYLAFRLQRDIELYTDQQWQSFLDRMEKKADTVRKATDVALAKAGEDKGANYDLIYTGGFQFAKRLNEEITMQTNRRSDLLDIMRSLYRTYAGTDVPVDRVILQEISEQFCACDLQDLFSSMLD